MILGSLLNASGLSTSKGGTSSSNASSPPYHPSPEHVQMLWGEEDPQLVHHHCRLAWKPNKTPEEIKMLWWMLPPLRDQYSNLYYKDMNPMQYSLILPEEKQKMDEHAHQHRWEDLPRMPTLQGLPPSPYLHLLDVWRPEKRKESYPAQGVKK